VTKYVLSAIHALIWSKLLALLCQPAMDGANLGRMLVVGVLIAGASALFMIASVGRFVGTGINAHTYSMDRASVFGLLFNCLVFFVILGMLLSVALGKSVFVNLDHIVIDSGTLFWIGHNGFFLDLPAYLVLAVFVSRHRKADLSRRIIHDRSCVFDSWW
jgi:hypothetical protein